MWTYIYVRDIGWGLTFIVEQVSLQTLIWYYSGLMGLVWIVRLVYLTVPYLSRIGRLLLFQSTKQLAFFSWTYPSELFLDRPFGSYAQY